MVDGPGVEPAGPHILFVCTGNVCRSPLAERLLQARLPAGSGLTAGSAGTAALVGRPMDPPSAAALARLGGQPEGHVARPLTDDLLDRADLVLGAEGHHRGVVLSRRPRLLRRTFTMREVARLAEAVDDDTLGPLAPAERVALLARRRGLDPPDAPGADDIVDPYRGGPAAADEIASQIEAVVTALLRLVGP